MDTNEAQPAGVPAAVLRVKTLLELASVTVALVTVIGGVFWRISMAEATHDLQIAELTRRISDLKVDMDGRLSRLENRQDWRWERHP